MAKDKGVEVQQLACTTSDKYITFEGGVQSLILTASTNDVYVDFEVPATSGTGFLVKKDVTNNQWDLHGSNITQLHAVSATSTATLTVIGIRN